LAFNSSEFLIFLPVVYLLYRLMNLRWQNMMLLVASYLFSDRALHGHRLLFGVDD
jgi:hypothetical protein